MQPETHRERPSAPRTRWYVIRTQAGFETKVRDAIRQRMQLQGLAGKLGEVLVPTTLITDRTASGTRVRQKNPMPGYVFIEMEMSDRARHVVTDTPRVKGFIGDRAPLALSPAQVGGIRQAIEEGFEKRRPRVSFRVGEKVRVREGPFANFSGSIQEVNSDKQKIRVNVSLFGRPTPVELDFSAVEKCT